MDHTRLAEYIIQLKNDDIALRNQLMEEGKLSDGYDSEMEKLHIRNAKVLEEIIDNIGYPTIDKVGKEANHAAWLIIQHSISQPKLMRKCHKLLEKAVEEQNENPIHLAYLTDRIAILDGGGHNFMELNLTGMKMEN